MPPQPGYANIDLGVIKSLVQMITGSPQDKFRDTIYPQILKDADATTNARDAHNQLAKFAIEASRAGLNPQQTEEFKAPFLRAMTNNLPEEELAKFSPQHAAARDFQVMAGELSPHTSYVNEANPNFQPAPEGANLASMLPAQPQTVPGRQFNEGDALKIAAIGARTGVNPPPGMAGLIDVPSRVGLQTAQAGAANDMASLHREQQKLVSQEHTERSLMEGKAGEIARANSPSLTSFENANASREQNAPLVNARVGTERARQGELGTRSQYNAAGIPLREAQTARANREAPSETVTETDRNVKPQDQLIAERTIAKMAKDRGAKTSEDIAKVADDLGYDLEGDVSIDDGSKSGMLGFIGQGSGPATLTGNFSLRPKATRKTTTKGKAAQGTEAPKRTPVNSKRPSLADIWGTTVK